MSVEVILRDLLDSYGLFGELIGRYKPYFPSLTEKMLGIDTDVSYTAIVAVLDKIIEEKLGITV